MKVGITVFITGALMLLIGLLIGRAEARSLRGDLDSARASYTTAYAKYEAMIQAHNVALGARQQEQVATARADQLQKAMESYRAELEQYARARR